MMLISTFSLIRQWPLADIVSVVAADVSSIGKENNHEQNVSRRSLRNTGRRPAAYGEILPGCFWLADADAGGGDGQLCHSHDNSNRRERPQATRRDQWRLFLEKARLAGSISFCRHRGR